MTKSSLCLALVVLTLIASSIGQQTSSAANQPGAAQPAGTPDSASPRAAQTAVLPDDPGVYLATQNSYTAILGETVNFARSGSVLASKLTLHIKAQHNNAQIQGARAQTAATSTPTFLFIPSQRELENGVSAGDLLLIILDVRGDRRQIELGAIGAARESKGVSITHQVETQKSLRAPHKHEIRPVKALDKGEYAFYLERGEGLPAMLYDFSVQ